MRKRSLLSKPLPKAEVVDRTWEYDAVNQYLADLWEKVKNTNKNEYLKVEEQLLDEERNEVSILRNPTGYFNYWQEIEPWTPEGVYFDMLRKSLVKRPLIERKK